MSGNGSAAPTSAAARARRLAGPGLTTRIRCLVRGYGLPRWGNLRRTTPFSSTFGFERGTPIDRHYLHQFLSAHRDRITGDVLEVQNASYTERFGHDVTRADTFDIVPQFAPTYLCDFAHCGAVIPDHSYDCLLLPNTLPHLRELDLALAHARRVVRPGGTILASAAGLLPLTGDVADYWRFSPDGWRERLVAAWPGAAIDVTGHGNCLAAVAAQLGLALEELTPQELDGHDPRYPVLTTILLHFPMTTLPFADSVKTGLLASGWYANRLERTSFPGVLSLCYHGIRESADDDGTLPIANLHVIADIFEAQCRMIAETCHPIDLETFRDAGSDRRALPERPVLVTFDDGYRSVFELARPILRRHRIPAAVFICSEPVRRQRLFWFDAVARALGADSVTELRAQPDEAWRRAADTHDTPAIDAPHLAPMTEAQVRQLADEGFAIGVHTASHAPLAQAPAEVQRHELESCRAAVESWTGRRADAVAYPFGVPRADYTDETVAIAESLGFTAGFTTRYDFARPEEPALERSRFVVLAAVTAAELAHRIAYAWPR